MKLKHICTRLIIWLNGVNGESVGDIILIFYSKTEKYLRLQTVCPYNSVINDGQMQRVYTLGLPVVVL